MELDIQNLDLYEILDIQESSSLSEIKRAYRKKALQCHPDKNPDNPQAAEEFRRLSKILEVLTNDAARSAYNKVWRARREAALRDKELNSQRKKLKSDLEARERQSATTLDLAGSSKDQKELNELIKNLRKEASRLVREEEEYVNRLVRENLNAKTNTDASFNRVKVKWKASKDDELNGGYTEEMLYRFFKKYGDIEALVVSANKKGRAMVEFKSIDSADMAVKLEQGILSNPLKCDWVNKSARNDRTESNLLKDSDFESVVMMKARQAEERKKLIAQMMAEDNEGN